MDYFDLYYAYLEKCKRENWVNLRDPHLDEMEWNHTLPQCIFKGNGPGQWLTLEQHAIASALQTLAFETNCLWGGMLKHLPESLHDLCLPYYKKMCSETIAVFTEEDLERRSKLMRETNLINYELGLHPMQKVENRVSASKRAKEWVQKMIEDGTHPSMVEGAKERISNKNLERVREGTHNLKGEEAAERASANQLRRVKEGTHQWKTPDHSLKVSERVKGAKHWVNEKGQRKFQKEKPEGEWQNGRKWREEK